MTTTAISIYEKYLKLAYAAYGGVCFPKKGNNYSTYNLIGDPITNNVIGNIYKMSGSYSGENIYYSYKNESSGFVV